MMQYARPTAVAARCIAVRSRDEEKKPVSTRCARNPPAEFLHSTVTHGLAVRVGRCDNAVFLIVVGPALKPLHFYSFQRKGYFTSILNDINDFQKLMPKQL